MGFFMAISPELLLAQTPHDIALNQFATKLSRQTMPFLEDAAKYIRNRLNNEWETVTSIKRLNSLQRDIDNQLSDIYGRMDDLLFSEFQALSVQEGQFTVDSVNEVLNDDFIMLPVEDQKLWSAVNNAPFIMNPKDGLIDFTKYVKGLSKSTVKLISNTIGVGYAYGLTLGEIKEGVIKVIETKDDNGNTYETKVPVKGVLGERKYKYTNGIIGGSPAAVERMVRTSINHIATQARLKVYNSNKRIVEGYRIIATLDSRTSPICQNYDQTVVMNDDKFKPYPPFHPNCRTTVIPEIKDKALEDSKGTRAANFKAQGDVKAGKVGQVPATTQYYDLLKKQSAAQQDLALGPARGKIFRNAGLSIPEFRKAMVDQMNQPITLSEMAAKNKKILEYMQSNKLSRYLDD